MHNKAISLLISAALLASVAEAEGLLTYKPPRLSAPQERVGGGTRSLGVMSQKIQVLAPPHIALTAKSSPTLYWYLPEITAQPIAFKLLQKNVDEPIFEKEFVVSKNGVQRISLADDAIELQAGEEYQWSVAFDDSESSATLIFKIPETALVTVEQQAEAGYWYDALAQLLESHSLLANALLHQIELSVPNL